MRASIGYKKDWYYGIIKQLSPRMKEALINIYGYFLDTDRSYPCGLWLHSGYYNYDRYCTKYEKEIEDDTIFSGQFQPISRVGEKRPEGVPSWNWHHTEVYVYESGEVDQKDEEVNPDPYFKSYYREYINTCQALKRRELIYRDKETKAFVYTVSPPKEALPNTVPIPTPTLRNYPFTRTIRKDQHRIRYDLTDRGYVVAKMLYKIRNEDMSRFVMYNGIEI